MILNKLQFAENKGESFKYLKNIKLKKKITTFWFVQNLRQLTCFIWEFFG